MDINQRPNSGNSKQYCVNYLIRSKIDLKKLFYQIDIRIIRVVNEITFCRFVLLEYLLKIKVSDILATGQESKNPSVKTDFYKIQEIKNRNFIQFLEHVDAKNQKRFDLTHFPYHKYLKNYFFSN